MRNSQRILVAGALASLTAPALAQSADEAALPDIVVTAERRSAPAQSVGVALSVLGGDTLANRGVTGVNQLQYQTPGLEAVPAFGIGQPQFRLRGVGFDYYGSNNASPVGISVDEIAKPLPVQTQGLLFDIARAEILRGPQGTLYGRNTTGGVINLLTAKPTDHLAIGADADYGSFGLFRAEGYASGPIGNGFAVRVAAGTEQGGGFQHNRSDGRDLGDADRWGARGQLAYAGGAVEMLLQYQHERDTSEGTGLYLFRPLGTMPADTDRRATGWGGSTGFASLTGIATDARPFRDAVSDAGNGRIDVDLGGAKLTSLTAYERLHRREYGDADATAQALSGLFFDSRVRVFSQEMRLASAPGAPLRWVAGGYFSSERLRERFLSDLPGYVAITTYGQRARTIAGFGQADYEIGALTLTAGARIEHERRKLIDFQTATQPGFGIGVSNVSLSTAYTQWSGKLGAQYRLSPSTLLYANVSRGIKSGGFTAYNTVTPDQLTAFKPEKLLAYEAGFKSQFADNRVRLNAAAFYYDYRDQQVQSAIYTRVVAPVGGFVLFDGPIGKVVNAPKAHIYGAEAELTWRPIRALEISQGLAWKKGVFDRFDGLDIDASVAAGRAVYVSRKGQDQGIPHWSYNGSATLTLPAGRAHQVTIAADYSYRDVQDPVLLGPVYKVGSYWLVNGSIGFGAADGRWRLGVYGRNIFNERYDLTRNFFIGGIDIASPGRPASYGVQASSKF
jgi:outer membrane receptor protein involved in Fe transport